MIKTQENMIKNHLKKTLFFPVFFSDIFVQLFMV